ncbi:unnamed protein product [Eruca vesicaria subsp. sativa]|uniref:Uncharacterized protein n=1 Tax=Eruca vesicaria subsp. sativa TaxID=29727 RepID=A0ABC8JPU8_ERUVS|nr:unnamed protein product [Eruca vesicaria subsp. sativa]
MCNSFLFPRIVKLLFIELIVNIRLFNDGNREHPYGHCLVAGLKKYLRKVIRKDSEKKKMKKSRVKCFIKVVNYQNLMPTRYTLDVDLKEFVTL